MGMRIHVSIGYGFDLTGQNKEHLVNRWEGDESLWDRLSEEIVEDIRKSQDDSEKSLSMSDRIFFGKNWHKNDNPERKPFHLGDFVDYDSEFLGEDRIIFRSYPFGRKWHRYDDDIDYFQAGCFGELGEPTDVIWRETKRSIYPHVGLMRPNPDWHMGVESYMQSCYMDGDTTDLTALVPLQVMFVMKHLLQIPEDRLVEEFMKVKPVYARWWS